MNCTLEQNFTTRVSRSLKVIANDTTVQVLNDILLVIHSNYGLSRTVSEIGLNSDIGQKRKKMIT